MKEHKKKLIHVYIHNNIYTKQQQKHLAIRKISFITVLFFPNQWDTQNYFGKKH